MCAVIVVEYEPEALPDVSSSLWYVNAFIIYEHLRKFIISERIHFVTFCNETSYFFCSLYSAFGGSHHAEYSHTESFCQSWPYQPHEIYWVNGCLFHRAAFAQTIIHGFVIREFLVVIGFFLPFSKFRVVFHNVKYLLLGAAFCKQFDQKCLF